MPHDPARRPLLAVVALGGALGASARYGVTQLVGVPPAGGFPWATFVTNVSGSLALGLVVAVLLERRPSSHYLRPFLATGVLGAYTTYSAFAVETDLLAKDGHAATAVLYALVSVLAGLLAVWAGLLGGPAAEHAVSALAWLGFLVAGATSAVLRAMVGGWLDGTRPWATLAVNVSGSLLLGVVTGLALYHGLSKTPAVILGAGFCGAYTTFSTFSYETVRLAEDGAIRQSFVNTAGTLVACAAAAAAGLAIAAI